ncbi:MAG: response regulator [Candidatus Rokubacteria bacterium]|nr:response regulator [Candidatus Rokubacteria bacterium]
MRLRWHPARGLRSITLALVSRFALLSFLCVISLALAMGFALSSLLTHAVSAWEWENTAAFARRSLEFVGLDTLFTAPQDQGARERWRVELSRLFSGFPEVVRLKVWDRTATILWSDEPHLIGRRFPENEELRTALTGKVAVEIKKLTAEEHVYERGKFVTLAEVYVPVFSRETGEVLGVLEVYKTPVRLFATIRQGQLIIWAISLAGGLALYTVLLPLVRQVYGREIQEQTLRAHAEKLEAEVAARTRALQRQTEQLLQAQKMEAVGLLAGGVAHDFNNLLTVIQGRGELLQNRLTPDDPLRRHVELIQSTAERAATLTRQLLAFSRKQVLQPQVLDLNAVVSGMEKMLRRLIGEDIALVTALDPGLGRVKADLAQLEQVILNLVVNARDAMPHGGRLTLETASVEWDETAARRDHGIPPGRYVVLGVSDTGVGMNAAIKAHIFEPFFTTKGPGKGTGLGLATVYGIVNQSGGGVTVDSEPERGATFRVYLPRVEQEAAGAKEAESRVPPRRGSETVLLVEDEEGVRDLTREILESYGYAVLEAADGSAALRVSARHPGPIHLLLTDVVMPEMSGSELARRLRPLRVEMKVLYASGYADDTIVRHGVSAARAALLPKPFTPEALGFKVREVLDTG